MAADHDEVAVAAVDHATGAWVAVDNNGDGVAVGMAYCVTLFGQAR